MVTSARTRPERAKMIVDCFADWKIYARRRPVTSKEEENFFNSLLPSSIEDATSDVQCLICRESFENEKQLREHKRTHTGVHPFVCSICGDQFQRMDSIRDHVLLHQTDARRKIEYAIMVEVLPISQQIEDELIFGLAGKDALISASCQICSEYCSDTPTLRLHYRTHTGFRPIKCRLCGVCDSDDKQMREHLNTHSIMEKDKYLKKIMVAAQKISPTTKKAIEESSKSTNLSPNSSSDPNFFPNSQNASTSSDSSTTSTETERSHGNVSFCTLNSSNIVVPTALFETPPTFPEAQPTSSAPPPTFSKAPPTSVETPPTLYPTPPTSSDQFCRSPIEIKTEPPSWVEEISSHFPEKESRRQFLRELFNDTCGCGCSGSNSECGTGQTSFDQTSFFDPNDVKPELFSTPETSIITKNGSIISENADNSSSNMPNLVRGASPISNCSSPTPHGTETPVRRRTSSTQLVDRSLHLHTSCVTKSGRTKKSKTTERTVSRRKTAVKRRDSKAPISAPVQPQPPQNWTFVPMAGPVAPVYFATPFVQQGTVFLPSNSQFCTRGPFPAPINSYQNTPFMTSQPCVPMNFVPQMYLNPRSHQNFPFGQNQPY